MNENIKKFLEKLAQDEQLAAKFNTCKTPEEAYAVAGGIVEGLSMDEFVAAMEQVKASFDDLTDDDLKKFAGGGEDSDLVAESLASVLSTTASISCLMAAI